MQLCVTVLAFLLLVALLLGRPAASFLLVSPPTTTRALSPADATHASCRAPIISGLYYAKGDDEHQHCDNASELTWEGKAAGASSSLQHAVPPMPVLMMEIGDDWKEWHYSFSRNGYTDFLPQFSTHLSCLMIGGSEDGGEQYSSRLPWQEEPRQAKITNMLFRSESGANGDNDRRHREQDAGKHEERLSPAAVDNTEKEHSGLSSGTNASVDRLTKSLFDSLSGAVDNGEQHAAIHDEEYDCIMDRGLMNSLLSSLTPHALRDHPSTVLELHSLMREANRAIREYGIYVVITDRLLSEHAKDYLMAIGENLGMQWKFDLDGISSDDEGGISVSVARKYFTGELPASFDRLATIEGVGADLSSSKHVLKP